jgi:hypothetical protein
MVAHDKPGASSNVKWFVILSMALIGGIFVAPAFTLGTFAQLDNATNMSGSNDTMSSNATGAAATDTNQTITQVAQQIARDDAEGTAIEQVLT